MDMLHSKEQMIITAAEQVFSQHGYEKATVDEIIAIADVGKGTVYKYFGNKEQLFYQLVLKRNAIFLERLDAAVTHAPDIEAKMIAFFTEMITFYKANSALWQIICFEMTGEHHGCMVQNIDGVPTVISRYNIELSESTKEQMLRYHAILESEFSILQSIMQQANDEGLLNADNVEIATKFLFFGVAMTIFHDHLETDKITPQEMAKITVHRFLNGIRK